MQTCDNLEELVLDNLSVILDALKIEYYENGQRFFFPCPIHSSDNYNSMSIYKDKGIAICFTKGCMGSGKGIFDFVSAVLNSNSYDEKDGRTFCEGVLGGFECGFTARPVKASIDYRVKEVDRSIIIPFKNPNIEFYLRRGYKRETLDKYDLFICKKKKYLLYGRATIPIYNDEHTRAVGFLGRSLNPKCNSCNKYHAPYDLCPTTAYEHIKSEKWLNSRGLDRNKLLFNYWYAKDSIQRTGTVLLVESPGNVMKLSQSGVENTLGIFGTALSKNQIVKLDGLGISRVYLGLDRDEAGEKAMEKIGGQLRGYECIPLIPPTNDYGDMADDEIVAFLTQNNFLF